MPTSKPQIRACTDARLYRWPVSATVLAGEELAKLCVEARATEGRARARWDAASATYTKTLDEANDKASAAAAGQQDSGAALQRAVAAAKNAGAQCG